MSVAWRKLQNRAAHWGTRRRRWQALLWDYAEGRLPFEARERLEAHLQTCEACRREANEYAETATRLSAYRDAAAPSTQTTWLELRAQIAQGQEIAARTPRVGAGRSVAFAFAGVAALCAALWFVARPASAPSARRDEMNIAQRTEPTDAPRIVPIEKTVKPSSAAPKMATPKPKSEPSVMIAEAAPKKPQGMDELSETAPPRRLASTRPALRSATGRRLQSGEGRASKAEQEERRVAALQSERKPLEVYSVDGDLPAPPSHRVYVMGAIPTPEPANAGRRPAASRSAGANEDASAAAHAAPSEMQAW